MQRRLHGQCRLPGNHFRAPEGDAEQHRADDVAEHEEDPGDHRRWMNGAEQAPERGCIEARRGAQRAPRNTRLCRADKSRPAPTAVSTTITAAEILAAAGTSGMKNAEDADRAETTRSARRTITVFADRHAATMQARLARPSALPIRAIAMGGCLPSVNPGPATSSAESILRMIRPTRNRCEDAMRERAAELGGSVEAGRSAQRATPTSDVPCWSPSADDRSRG
jgi:hypothetical protein